MKYTVSLPTAPKCGQESSSGNSERIADGFITPPDSWWAPATRPFSITATGTSPSDSARSGSSSSSWSRRIAHTMPAWPPPTIATPTSIRSSSGSVGTPMNSAAGSTGGGYSMGATGISASSCESWCARAVAGAVWQGRRPAGIPPGFQGSRTPPGGDQRAIRVRRDLQEGALAALAGLHGLGELRDDLVEVADDAEVGELEDRRVRVLVDRDDVLGALHPDLVLDRAGDARGEVELRRDGLAGLADLGGVGVPARGDDRAAERAGQLLERLEALGLAEPAAAGDEDVGVLDVDVGAALLATHDHLRPRRVRLELDLEVLDGGARVSGLLRLERVQAPDDHADVGAVVDVGDARVLQDRTLGHQL